MVAQLKKPYEAALVAPKSPQERAIAAAAHVAKLLPVVGGSISSILNAESNDRRWRRLEEFLLGLYDDVAQVTGKVKDGPRSEEFEALLEETLRKVADEPRPEKRELYRRFLERILRTAEHPDERRILRLIDELTLDHVRVLRAMAEPPSDTHLSISSVEQTIATRTGGDIGRDRTFDIVGDLNAMRLTQMTRLGTTMSGTGAQDLTSDITRFGHKFLRYIE